MLGLKYVLWVVTWHNKTIGCIIARNWGLCFICQSQKENEGLVCPAKSFKLQNSPGKLGACYRNTVENIWKLQELEELPEFVFIDDITAGNDGSDDHLGGVSFMLSMCVLWHKSCRNAIDHWKVRRAQRKKAEVTTCSPVKTRCMDNGTASGTPSEACTSTAQSSCLFYQASEKV